MRRIPLILLMLTIVGLVTLSSCGDDDTPEIDPVEAATEDLSFTWNATSVSFEGEDRTAMFTGFSLTITDGSYSTTEVETRDPWPSSGSWSFDEPETIDLNTTTFDIVRGDGLEILATLTNDGSNLTLILQGFDEAVHDGQRVEAVNGDWTFEFSRVN